MSEITVQGTNILLSGKVIGSWERHWKTHYPIVSIHPDYYEKDGLTLDDIRVVGSQAHQALCGGEGAVWSDEEIGLRRWYNIELAYALASDDARSASHRPSLNGDDASTIPSIKNYVGELIIRMDELVASRKQQAAVTQEAAIVEQPDEADREKLGRKIDLRSPFID